MPVPLVDLEEIETPPPLPDLPTGGTGGTGGTSGTGGTGTGGAGNGGSGGRSISLIVSATSGNDPRYVDFDRGRVENVFYDGYCDCSDSPNDPACTNDLNCCDGTFCVFDDQPSVGKSSCRACVEERPASAPGGQQCEATSECCQRDPARRSVCYPMTPAGGQTYCHPCRQRNEVASDANADLIADFGECCPGLGIFKQQTQPPVCSGPCRHQDESCNFDTDCCDELEDFIEFCHPTTKTCDATANPG
jgi:hypothetical protein